MGKVESLSGLCEDCGSEPRLRRFSRSFIEWSIAGVVSIEILALLIFLGSWKVGLLMLIAVAAVGATVYFLANKTQLVRYRSEAERKAETLGQRILGGLLGFAVGLGVLLAFVSFKP